MTNTQKSKPLRGLKILLSVLASIIGIIVLLFFILKTPDIEIETLKEKYVNAHSKFVEIDGANVHYRIEGKREGIPLVLLHGTGASLHTWDEWTKHLRDSFQIVRLDLPAFGLTGQNAKNDYSIEAYDAMLEQFLNHLKIDSIYLAGNSLGGRIAWNYALTHPEKVQKLILVDPAGFPFKLPGVLKLARIPILNQFIKHITPKWFIEKNLHEVYGDVSKVNAALINRYHDMTLRAGNRDAFIARAKLNFKDKTSELKNINCPTLIQWGEKDIWIPVSDASRFKAAIPNSKLIVYPNVGHVPMEEIPLQTAKDAIHFLQN